MQQEVRPSLSVDAGVESDVADLGNALHSVEMIQENVCVADADGIHDVSSIRLKLGYP
jgi:hypothetical protein